MVATIFKYEYDCKFKDFECKHIAWTKYEIYLLADRIKNNELVIHLGYHCTIFFSYKVSLKWKNDQYARFF